MIEVSQATQIIAGHVRQFGVEEVELSASMNRILKEDWVLDRDLPPFNRVTMDRIAIRYEAFAKGLRSFPIEGTAAAGTPEMTLQNPEGCLEVMTGAMLPAQADTVIRYEDLLIENGIATVIPEAIVNDSQNVHFKGIDRKANEIVVPVNTRIASPEIGIGASLGKSRVKVAALPKVMIISTGDELVDIDEKPEPHQIRRSNSYLLMTALQAYRIEAREDHLPDEEDIIREKLARYLEEYDVVILSGGVSEGKFDYLPKILTELGVEKRFHKIKQRPGKPFWFGNYKDSCTIFALPGNPVSSFVCLNRYFLYWLNLCLAGELPPRPQAMLAKDVVFKPDLTYFLEVKLNYNDQGQILATPMQGNGSGDFANLTGADAFIELPRGKDLYKAGEVYDIYLYR
jgi:molybdopterin molybdotransferase